MINDFLLMMIMFVYDFAFLRDSVSIQYVLHVRVDGFTCVFTVMGATAHVLAHVILHV